MAVSSELQSGLVNLVYYTWLHNAEAIAYVTGAVMMLGLQFFKPRRIYLLFFLAFTVLFIEFEYVKHIVEPLQQQTLQTVLEQGSQGTRFKQYLSFILEKLIPLGLYLIGWGSLFLGIWVSTRSSSSGGKPLS